MHNFFKKKPQQSNSAKNLSHQYFSIKQKIELPLKIKFFLQVLQNSIQDGTQKKKIPKQILEIYKQFGRSFGKLTNQEKYYFMLAMIRIIKNLLQNKNYQQNATPIEYECKINMIETTCEVRQFFMGVSHWQDRIFKFSNLQKVLKICTNNNSKKQIIYQLPQYHLRGSSKQKNTLVLELSFDSWNIPEKYHSLYIYFKDKNLFNQIYNNIRNAIIISWKTKLIKMLNESEKQKIMENLNQNSTVAQLRMLTSKTISEYFNKKQKIMNKVRNGRIKFKLFNQTHKVKIYRSSKFQNLYKTQNILNYSYEDVIKNIELINRVPCKKLIHYQKMQTFSSTISAIYYKYVVKGSTHQMISLVEEKYKQNQCNITFNIIENFTMDKNVDFIQITAQKVDLQKTKIKVFGFINFQQNKKSNPIRVIDFLLSIVQYQQNQSFFLNSSTIKTQTTFHLEPIKNHEQCPDQNYQNDQNDEDQFYTVAGQNFNSDQQRQLQVCNTFHSQRTDEGQNNPGDQNQEQTEQQRNIINEFKNLQTTQNRKTSRQLFEQINPFISQNQYLRKKYIFQPKKKSDKERNLIKQHYFLGEWAKYEKGGVYSLNSNSLDKQKQIYRSILTRLGNALMKKKLSNISIPVVILKPESQLQSIARNLSYAPLLLQNLLDKPPVQKMKNVIILMITMGTIGLSLSKPFNPILGQTFQAYIDNCPIYMEQTEHHPCVSTLYFKGRGYQISGSVIPSISLRLNSVKCFSQATFKVKFQDNDIIQFAPSKMLVGGLLVGDRTFDFTETRFFWDKANNIISQITFGPKKKFGKHMKGDKTDFLWGYIYKVSQSFMSKFFKDGKSSSPFLDKTSKILAQIYGCWHEKIYIDDNVIFDFETQLPYNLQKQKIPLKSDCTYRKDIAFMLEQDYPNAQDEKDRVEQIQRYDARLRKQKK